VESVATPEAFRVAVPSTVEPFKKLIDPVGVEVPLQFTVAVRVSAWPAVTGFGEAIRLVVVDRAFTVTGTAAEALRRKLALPVYWAVRL
jgi:hypothetical protein